MNVSLRWLKDVAPGLDMTLDAVQERLALRGFPVEGVVDPGQGLDDVVVGRVLEAGKHPNADRLSLCRVEGPDGEVQVVCGAPHIEVGALYPFAPVGAVLPGDFRIERRKIRGEYSEGMLCSETELRLGQDGSGIMKLDLDVAVGTPFREAMALDDARLDVEVTPNRGDVLSHVGVARELHPAGARAIRLPEIPGGGLPEVRVVRDTEEVTASGVTIRIEDPDLCFRFMGAVIRGVRVGPSPEWLQARIRAAGARPINNVVDATNYVLLESGHPLHAYDLARLEGPDIVVRRARTGEELRTLDGEERPITEDMLMICDAERPVGIGGIMGGEETEVTDQTVDVLLECALFEPKQIRATRRALGMSTDASYRFERGVDPEGREPAILRAAEIILATAGGTLDDEVLDVNPRVYEPLRVNLRPSRVAHLLGVPFNPAEIEGLLLPLGYEIEQTGDDVLSVLVPGFRSYDTVREVDLIEEVARTHGYDAFPDTLRAYRPGTVPDHPFFQLEDGLRHMLSGVGLSEAQTPTLGPEGHGDVALLNPMSRQESHLRRDRLTGLLSHVERNLARGVRDVRLFELGTAFAPSDPRPLESPRVAVTLTGRATPVHWSGQARPYDVFDIGHVLDLIRGLVYPQGEIRPGTGGAKVLKEGAAYELRGPGGQTLGWAGVVEAHVLDLPPWAGQVLGLEVVLPDEPAPSVTVAADPPPSHPASGRDLAFLVPDHVEAGTVTAAIRAGGGDLLESVGIFDVYRGPDLPDGMRSVAYGLSFRGKDRTLTDEDVDEAVSGILRSVQEMTGVQPRV